MIITVSSVYVVCCTFFLKCVDKSRPILFDFLTCSMNCLFVAFNVFRVLTFEDHKLIPSPIYLNYIFVIYYIITVCVSIYMSLSVCAQ